MWGLHARGRVFSTFFFHHLLLPIFFSPFSLWSSETLGVWENDKSWNVEAVHHLFRLSCEDEGLMKNFSDKVVFRKTLYKIVYSHHTLGPKYYLRTYARKFLFIVIIIIIIIFIIFIFFIFFSLSFFSVWKRLGREEYVI